MKRLAAAIVMVAVGVMAARAEFVDMSVKMPAERAVKNVEAWIKEKPEDAHAHYVLARVHAMAWAYGPNLTLWQNRAKKANAGKAETQEAPREEAATLPGFAPYATVRVVRRLEKARPAPVTPEDAEHLRLSIQEYRKAVELDGKQAIYELGLAWVLGEAGKVVKTLPAGFPETKVELTAAERASIEAQLKKLESENNKDREAATKALLESMPRAGALLRDYQATDAEVAARIEKVLKGYFDLQALAHYRKVYELAQPKDDKQTSRMMGTDDMLSLEAGQHIVKITSAYPETAVPGEKEKIEANFVKLNARPMKVTPIIFGFENANAVGQLVDAKARVRFDVAGDGLKREWPWVKKTTGILVWDPEQTGKILDGKQLFGSVTWWIAFRDGYEAMSVLDDDRDGFLSGGEMDGISVWVDRNGNGVSDAGEVKTLREAGVVRMGIRAVTGADGVLTATNGVEFADGRVVATFDLVVEGKYARR